MAALTFEEWQALQQQKAQQAKAQQGGSGPASIVPAAILAAKYGPKLVSSLTGGGAAASSAGTVGGEMTPLTLGTENSIANLGSTGANTAPVTGLGAAAPYLGLGGAALGGYGVYNAIKSGNAKSGAMSGAALGGGLAAASPLLLGTGPVGWGILGASALGGAGLGAGLTKLLHHENTRETTAKNTGKLQAMGQGDAAWQNYVNGMREQYKTAPTGKAFDGGKYGSWDEYKTAGLDAKDLTGVYGNMSTFGPDWAKYSQDQRQNITQALIDNNLYDSKKGDVIVNNSDLAKKLGADVLAGKYKSPVAAPVMANDKVGNMAKAMTSVYTGRR